jgi:two-component system, NarL family, nitrate/nitrite response regulator NarL
MKLKTLPAPSAAPTATAPTAVPKLSDNARISFTIEPQPLSGPAADPFGSFVRKHIHGRELSPGPAGEATNPITGAVLAETDIDGVHYVVLRCTPKPNEALLSLSPRERDIVNLIIKGYPNKMIAELLDISAWTVGTHLRRIFAKLGVTSRAAMVARYLQHVGEAMEGRRERAEDRVLQTK